MTIVVPPRLRAQPNLAGRVGLPDLPGTPDLFGRDGAKRRAARARAAASFQDVQAVKLRVSVEIARAYVQRATLVRRLELVDTSLTTAAELDRIIRVRNQEGAASKVEVGLQSIRLKQLQAERSRISEALDQTRGALVYLVGEEAPGFKVTPGDLTAFTTPAIEVPSPTQLIESRPDIVPCRRPDPPLGGRLCSPGKTGRGRQGSIEHAVSRLDVVPHQGLLPARIRMLAGSPVRLKRGLLGRNRHLSAGSGVLALLGRDRKHLVAVDGPVVELLADLAHEQLGRDIAKPERSPVFRQHGEPGQQLFAADYPLFRRGELLVLLLPSDPARGLATAPFLLAFKWLGMRHAPCVRRNGTLSPYNILDSPWRITDR
ncbi:TolC family protein [Sphingomonas sp.]|uniref:TolC family protein n=1 Tax=Sphingomonas sp. TaxID=28214 RepID=UPI002EDBA8DF